MHMLLSNIKWESRKKSLPKYIVVLDCPEGLHSEDDLIDAISDAISDAFGYTHSGFTHEDLVPFQGTHFQSDGLAVMPCPI